MPLDPILSQMNLVTPSHTLSLKSVLILSSHPRLFIPIRLFSSGCAGKMLYAFYSCFIIKDVGEIAVALLVWNLTIFGPLIGKLL
jgi:hypothetical protein